MNAPTRPSADILATAEQTVPRALQELAAGRPVLVADSSDRENEVDVILSAQLAEESWIGWTVRRTSGYLCAPLPEDLADRLDLPLMVPRTQDQLRTAYTVSVDASSGVTTGISAADRTRTLHALADPASTPVALARPGHVLPLRAVPGGVRVRPGHTEAAVDLCRAAGLAPVGVISELVTDEGPVMRLPQAEQLAAEHDLVLLTIEQLAAWLDVREAEQTPTTDATADATADAADGAASDQPTGLALADRVERRATAQLPTSHGRFTVHGYRDRRTGAEHLAVSADPPAGAETGGPTLVRVHSECLTGEAFGSARCECGPQLDAALEEISRRGGVVVYLRGHEGRGIGLLEKLAAYELQDAGHDTVTANHELGWPADLREYGAAAAILQDLGITAVDLLTNNPLKIDALTSLGISVERTTRLLVGLGPDNAAYMRTKALSMGHLIPTTEGHTS